MFGFASLYSKTMDPDDTQIGWTSSDTTISIGRRGAPECSATLYTVLIYRSTIYK